MISFWTSEAGTFGMERWLAYRMPDLTSEIAIRTYESVTPELEVTSGAHIFSGLDQLGPAATAVVTSLYQILEERCPGDRLLNNPRTVPWRYELLTRMVDAGINGFRARRAGESLAGARYPVFLREETGHGGPLTAMLGSSGEVARALRALRIRGHRTADLLVIEFCDLSDEKGLFHTGAACKVGDVIVPYHMLQGRNWVLKWSNSDHDESAMRGYHDYTMGKPHQVWLRQVFTLAGVDYGRIDYGIRGDTLQVWEINLNPTIGPGPGPPHTPFAPELESLLQEGRRTANGKMRDAFRALDPAMGHDRVVLQLDATLVARMHAEMADARRRRARVEFLRRIYHKPRIGWPLRKASSWLMDS